MIQTMDPNRMQTGVAGNDLETMPRGGITRNDGVNIFK
jgi:hypothetical protein